MDEIRKALKSFDIVKLSDINNVRLMNRIDTKYCLNKSMLPSILNDIDTDYFVLEIQNELLHPYQTTYLDTPDDKMYLAHQNGWLNRHKVRVREYELSNDKFLEVKLKTNKGRCIKSRIGFQKDKFDFTDEEKKFLNQKMPYHPAGLEPKIKNWFRRITLVNKGFTERVTIDIHPSFQNEKGETLLRNLVIVEIKQERSAQASEIKKVLKKNRVRLQRFSKYCIGRALLEGELKQNRFKSRIMRLQNEFN